MSLKVLNNPFFATIQDRGRFSYSHLGFSNSGVMDEYAYFIANMLLANSLDTNILEIGSSNTILSVNENTVISITGANCEFFINDELKPTWQSHYIKKGDILKIGKIIEGNWVYLSILGGFELNKELGSFSTTLRENIGGLNGNRLKKNDILPYKRVDKNIKNYKTFLKKEYIPKYENELVLRVILSYQYENFPQQEIKKFFSSTYFVTKDFNRMGVKLKGEVINCNINGIISEGIAYGSIQIPKDGQPIILLKERQTIGGYPKIGTLLSIDCFKLAHAKEGVKIRFVQITYEEALQKTKEFYFSCSVYNNLSKTSFDS